MCMYTTRFEFSLLRSTESPASASLRPLTYSYYGTLSLRMLAGAPPMKMEWERRKKEEQEGRESRPSADALCEPVHRLAAPDIGISEIFSKVILRR